MENIKKVWLENNRIYIELTDGTTHNRPLEAFPTIMETSDEERARYEIRFGDSLRWEELDEDIHVSSFFETSEPNYDNEVADLLRNVNIEKVAGMINVHKSVLLSYIYGMKKPTEIRLGLIKDAIRKIEQ